MTNGLIQLRTVEESTSIQCVRCGVIFVHDVCMFVTALDFGKVFYEDAVL